MVWPTLGSRTAKEQNRTDGFMTHVTCRLSAKNRDQLRNRTLGNRVWATNNFMGSELPTKQVHCMWQNSAIRPQSAALRYDTNLLYKNFTIGRYWSSATGYIHSGEIKIFKTSNCKTHSHKIGHSADAPSTDRDKCYWSWGVAGLPQC